MTNSNNRDGIEAQYTQHPYPAPISNMRERIRLGYRQGSSPDFIWSKLFPEKPYKDDLNVLIAGCGTNQAIYHALMFPKSQHYAIDVSDTSLNHVKAMAKKYDLKNLEIEKKEISELTFKNEFDYVISTGVIHHTKDPQENLSKLVDTTKTDGALNIMVYASYLRVGVYFLQDAFGHLGLSSTKEDIEIAKKLIALTPKNHYIHSYIEALTNSTGTQDLEFDAGFVDTFFNERDVAFDVFELKELIRNSGAYFQCWSDNSLYYRTVIDFSKVNRLNHIVSNLDPWELADFTQKIWPNSGKFDFVLRKVKKHEHRFFKITDIMPANYAHKYRLTDREKPDISSNNGGSIGNDMVEIKLDIIERIVWDNLNNKIEDVLNMSNELFSKHGIDKELTFEKLRGMLHRFWRQGYLSFSDQKQDVPNSQKSNKS